MGYINGLSYRGVKKTIAVFTTTNFLPQNQNKYHTSV